MLKTKILTIEIGSTITKVNAFAAGKKAGGAIALTTPNDVMAGFNTAMADLKRDFPISLDTADEVYVLSSAAGGLRMSVHGLTWNLTARAAEEAAAGAGANIRLVTAGAISPRHIERLDKVNPSLILLAGGVENGEEKTVYHNASMISQLDLKIPVIYAGNKSLQKQVRDLFKKSRCPLHVVDNVYPNFDELNIGPVREIIQEIFSEHLIIARGIEELKKKAGRNVMPVPAACLWAAELLGEELGDLMAIDVGGATTDVYSIVKAASPGNLDVQVPSRRSVEGDLGLFVSAPLVWKAMGRKGVPRPLRRCPKREPELKLSCALAAKTVDVALARHAGKIMHGAYLSGGNAAVKGQDLRKVKLIVGTGGGLARLEGSEENIRQAIRNNSANSLVPGDDITIKIDNDYVFAACGAFSRDHPELAVKVIKDSIS